MINDRISEVEVSAAANTCNYFIRSSESHVTQLTSHISHLTPSSAERMSAPWKVQDILSCWSPLVTMQETWATPPSSRTSAPTDKGKI